MKGSESWTTPAAMVLAIRVAGALLNALVLVWLARTYPQFAVGQFGLIWAVWVLGRVIGPLGYDQAALRFLSVAWAQDRESARSMASWQLRRIVKTNMRVAAMGLGAAVLVSLWDGNYGIALMVAALGHPLASSQGILAAQARAIGRPLGAAAIEAVAIPLLIGVVSVLPRDLGLVDVDALPPFQLVVLGLVHLLYLWQQRSWRAGACRAEPESANQQRRLARTAVTAIAATAVSTKGPVILISAFAGLRGGALFEVSQRIQNLGAMPTSSVAIVVSPIFARMGGANHGRELRRLVLKAGTVASLPAVVFTALMVSFGRHIVQIFGEGYQDAYRPAVALLCAAAVNGFFGLSSNALLMTGRERFVRRAGLLQLASVILFVPLGVATSGVTGGAVAVLGAVILRDVSLWSVLMWRETVDED